MKIRNLIFAVVPAVLLAAAVSCDRQESPKSLVVYYSQTGTTAKVAEQIALAKGADIVELQCEVPYPDTYQGTIEESREECMNGTGRALVNAGMDLSKYDTIYVGYPIWYGTFAPPIVTFVNENDLTDKAVVLFCTYGSGGRKASERDFKKLCPETRVIDTYGISARKIDIVADDVAAFLSHLGEDTDSLTGAYSKFRPLEEEDLIVFNKAMENHGYLQLTPDSVSTQVVAGLNYIFRCNSVGPDGSESTCDVHIFRPLEGDPYLKGVER